MMLQSFAQSQDWLYTEPLLFDDEFCQSLMKDLQSLPTPPQSPPMKSGAAGGTGAHHKPLSKEDQLSYVSDILLEDHDMQLNWNCDFFDPDYCDVDKPLDKELPRIRCVSLGDGEEESLWRCLGGGEKGGLLVSPSSSVLGSSPLLSDIDTSIFQEIAGSTLAMHAAAAADDLVDSQEQQSIESTSDYGSAGGELSTYSSSDSEEEIDVVTVVRCSSSSPSPLPSLAELSARQQQQRKEEEAEELRRRFNFDIAQQHNYAAPCPASPPHSSCSTSSSSSGSSKKRSRGRDSSRHHRHHSSRHHSSRHYSPSSGLSSSSSRHHHHHSSRASTETEDEEERRRTHNVMERQRRNELKNCFLRLRDNVPELSHNDKASKVVILKRARDSIHTLEVEDHRLLAKRDRLKEKQQRLKARLEQLRGF